MAGVIGAGDGPLDELTEVGSIVVCGNGVPISVGVELDNLLTLLLTCNTTVTCTSTFPPISKKNVFHNIVM